MCHCPMKSQKRFHGLKSLERPSLSRDERGVLAERGNLSRRRIASGCFPLKNILDETATVPASSRKF